MSAKLPAEVFRVATHWYVRLHSEDVSEADRLEWQRWKEMRQENAAAWQRVEEVTGVFQGVPFTVGMVTLNRPLRSAGRRRALKQLAILAAAGAGGWLASSHEPWEGILADYSTATGEQREVVLADGTRIHLNTATAIDVAFDADQRLIRLIKGEVLIVTGHGSDARHQPPLIVQTRHGSGKSLGTQFSVRQFDARSRISVFEHAVEVVPSNNSNARLVLNAGESVEFNDVTIWSRGQSDATDLAWSKGFMVVDRMLLGAFLNELGRYRKGILRCDPAIATLRISGAFPLGDTDVVLSSIAHTLPLRIETYTRYWVNVRPV